jgi:hypothetical protein
MKCRPIHDDLGGIIVPRMGSIRLLAVLLWWMLAPAVALAGSAPGEPIVSARYVDPTERYGHFALGRPHEYASLRATIGGGRELQVELPAHEVFEDLAPRLVRLAPGEPPLLLTIVSSRDAGARLVLFEQRGDALVKAAESSPVGTPMRWMNPVGVADLNGDGRAEIAAVVTPHIGGTLKVWRRAGTRLVEVGALGGFSNHVYGSSELALSAPLVIDGRTVLAVPDATRMQLRLIAFDGRRLTQAGECSLAEPLRSALVVRRRAGAGTRGEGQGQAIDLDACRWR